MPCYLYRLQFTAPVHFGAAGVGMEGSDIRLRADAWTSAIVNALAVLGEADRAIEALRQRPPAFLLSSLFPYGPESGRGAIVYLVPRPATAPPAESAALRRAGKSLKRLAWLTPAQAVRWLSDEPLTGDELETLAGSSSEKPLVARRRDEAWWWNNLRPRVALDRASAASQIWLCGTVTFAPEAGLYGFVLIRDAQWQALLETALHALGEMGIGGERTYGMGQFRFQGFEAPGPEWRDLLEGSLPRRLLLSVYHPAPDERERLASEWEAWDWFESRGYVTSGRQATTLKRHRVRFLSEGSVTRGSPTGMLAEVTPVVAREFGIAHRCYRSGLAFLAPHGESR